MDGQEYQNYETIIPEPEPEKGGKGKKLIKIAVLILVAALALYGTYAGVSRLGEKFFGWGQGTTQDTDHDDLDADDDRDDDDQKKPAVQNQQTGTVQLLDVSDVVALAMPSVVAIELEVEVSSTNMWGQSTTQKGVGSGSGVIIDQNSSELLIVTNAHVVSISSSLSTYYEITSTGLKVQFADGSEAEAYLKGSNNDMDLAVIAVPLKKVENKTLEAISIATVGNSDELRVGNGVIAIGNALGFGQSVTVGYVSALNRDVTIEGVTRSLLQVDAAINPGNSGGALLNTKGELIGINAAKYSDESVEGIGYAIPITKVKDIINNLKEMTAKVEVPEDERGYLGISGVTVDNASIQIYRMPAGVYISEVLSGTPAAKSELAARDIVTKINGETVSSMTDLQNLLKYYRAGEKVTVTLKRLSGNEYVEKSITVTLATAEELNQ